ncbi:MAG: hypothetical protein Q9M94_00840, partial [Candidatus Gracilibacteria bacterium]|nr:hypothetical protein [Candidatus Gracilibacteria bacterium]
MRPRAIYGDGDRVLVPNILKNQIFGKLILPGNGKNKTSITEINDFVNFIGNFFVEYENIHTLQKFQIYNFASETKTYNQLFYEISENNNLKGIIHIPLCVFKFLSIFLTFSKLFIKIYYFIPILSKEAWFKQIELFNIFFRFFLD